MIELTNWGISKKKVQEGAINLLKVDKHMLIRNPSMKSGPADIFLM